MASILKIGFLCALAISLSVALPADVHAQRKKEKSSKQEPPPEPPMIQVPAGVETKTIEVQGLAMRMSSGKAVGSVQGGLFCNRRDDYKIRGGSGPFTDPAYIDRLNNLLSTAGYSTAGNTASMFQDRDEGKADYLIGGVIVDIKANICFQENEFTGPYSGGDGEITVEWQVYNTRERRVEYESRTTGTSKVKIKRNGEPEVLLEAFGLAAHRLLAQQNFYDLLAGTPADLAALGPSASGEASSGAAANIPATQISRLPLTSQKFQDRATDIRGNVVTVFSGSGSGSGFFVSERHILTNAHVVGAAKFVKLKLITGREILGDVVTSDSARDVALIQAEAAGFPGLPIRLDEASIGSQVFAVGSPLGESNEGTVSSGIISSYRTEDGLRYIQSDVNTMPGNSGGPLLDDKGNIIGMTVSGQLDPRTGGGTGLNFFIPIADAMARLNLQFR